jgi:membrane protein required for colicin V production
MHIFDIICFSIALIFIFIGIYRGFVEEAMRLIAVLVAFFAGLYFYRFIVNYIKFIPLSPSFLAVIAFILIFVISILIVILLGKALKKIIHLTVLGFIDRICGGIIGFVKAFFFVIIFVMIIASMPFPPIKNWFLQSKTYSLMINFTPQIYPEKIISKSSSIQTIFNSKFFSFGKSYFVPNNKIKEKSIKIPKHNSSKPSNNLSEK